MGIAISPPRRARTAVCTENSILIDYVTESPNVSGDDRSVMLLPDPVHLAVQVEEPSEQSSENEQCNNTHHDWIRGVASCTRAATALPRKGFSMKSSAPFLRASIAI